MKITSITKKNGTRWQIEVDDEYWAILDAEIIVNQHLKVGAEALYLLDYRDHSRGEIVEKLSRNVDRVIAEEVADKLCELGLIDDGTYAKKLARHFLLTKKYGARRAEFEMRRKGIDGRLAAEAVAEVEPDEDLLEELALIKYGRYLEDDPDGKGRDKAIRGLMRLGHGYYEAEAAVDAAAARLEADTDEPEDL